MRVVVGLFDGTFFIGLEDWIFWNVIFIGLEDWIFWNVIFIGLEDWIFWNFFLRYIISRALVDLVVSLVQKAVHLKRH
jgi:hypothetical protein